MTNHVSDVGGGVSNGEKASEVGKQQPVLKITGTSCPAESRQAVYRGNLCGMTGAGSEA